MNFKSSRPIIITRPDGSEVEYPSQAAAARDLKLHQSPISEMCRGYKKTHHGYKARWKTHTLERSGEVPADAALAPSHSVGDVGHSHT